MSCPSPNSCPEAAGAGLGAVAGPAELRGCASKHVALAAGAKSSKESGPPVPRQRRAKCCAGLSAARLSLPQPPSPPSKSPSSGASARSRAMRWLQPEAVTPTRGAKGRKSRGFGLNSSLRGFPSSQGCRSGGSCRALSDEFAVDEVRARSRSSCQAAPASRRRASERAVSVTALMAGDERN